MNAYPDDDPNIAIRQGDFQVVTDGWVTLEPDKNGNPGIILALKGRRIEPTGTRITTFVFDPAFAIAIAKALEDAAANAAGEA